MQLDFLKSVFATTGPYATAYFDVIPTENAAREIALRWRALREQLSSAGVSDKLLDAMQEAAVRPPTLGGRQGRFLVGAGEGLLIAEALSQPPRPEGARWDVLPHLYPLVREHASVVPHVRVLCDRVGADITVTGPLGDDVAEEHVKGGTYPIRRHGRGGWAQRRFEERAENLWDRNARKVAESVDRLVAQTGAQLVVAAGDVRAVTYLRDELGERARGILTVVDTGARTEGIDAARLEEEMRQVVQRHAEQALQPLIDAFEQERGRQGAACEGLAPVVAALQKAQVDTLLLAVDDNVVPLVDGEQLWAGPDPLQLGVNEADVRALNADEAWSLRADDVLIRAVAGTDASIVLVPQAGGPQLQQGVAAVLRYADESTSHQ